jgi:hypothetical protein
MSAGGTPCKDEWTYRAFGTRDTLPFRSGPVTYVTGYQHFVPSGLESCGGGTAHHADLLEFVIHLDLRADLDGAGFVGGGFGRLG